MGNIRKLISNDEVIALPKDISDNLSEYFINVGEDLANKINYIQYYIKKILCTKSMMSSPSTEILRISNVEFHKAQYSVYYYF